MVPLALARFAAMVGSRVAGAVATGEMSAGMRALVGAVSSAGGGSSAVRRIQAIFDPASLRNVLNVISGMRNLISVKSGSNRLSEMMDIAVRNLKNLTPVKTGATRDGWRGRYFVQQTEMGFEVTNERMKTEHGKMLIKILESGAKPHTITAKGLMLKFQMGGKTVFAQRVRHPGVKGIGMIRATETLMEQMMNQYSKDIVAEAQQIFERAKA